MRQGWISEEARLWNQLMDSQSYYVRRPSAYELRNLPSKKRAKRIQKYKNDVAEQFTRSWKNYSLFIHHMPP